MPRVDVGELILEVMGWHPQLTAAYSSELAGQAGVNPETLRYYERRGLLYAPRRTAGGYRDYPAAAVELLRFIKRAQQLGFTLDDVEELLHLNNGGPDSCDTARALAETRQADLEARIADLRRMRDSLADLIASTARGAGEPVLTTPLRPELAMIVNLTVLHVTDCPNLAPMLQRLRQVTDLPVTIHEITTDAGAAADGMAGSPTLLIDGIDPFRSPDQHDHAVACRIYRDVHGHPAPAPSLAQLRAALAAAETTPAPEPESTSEPEQPGELLNAWRTRALPLEPVAKAVHQVILRAIATTGQPPAASDLAAVTVGSGRTSAEVLKALHDLDAIRLDTDRRIAVAYPFSTDPTRHRVQIANQVNVHAMCAIDALGIAPMLGLNTRINSTDATTGQPVTVTTIEGRTSWYPPGAVAFIGTTAGAGPSAGSCCNYLNFFTDEAAAKEWTDAHPHVPGQVLHQKDAEALALRLFGPLLGPPLTTRA